MYTSNRFGSGRYGNLKVALAVLFVFVLMVVAGNAKGVVYDKAYFKPDMKKVKLEYKILSEKQKRNVWEAYVYGNNFTFNNEKSGWGYTLATYVAVESSYGTILKGDNGNSHGWTHFGYTKARELLQDIPLHEHLASASNEVLAKELKKPYINMHLTMVNLKKNLDKYDNDYKKGVKAHNGYLSPRLARYDHKGKLVRKAHKGFKNHKYWKHFKFKMEVVKLVVKEMKNRRASLTKEAKKI